MGLEDRLSGCVGLVGFFSFSSFTVFNELSPCFVGPELEFVVANSAVGADDRCSACFLFDFSSLSSCLVVVVCEFFVTTS